LDSILKSVKKVLGLPDEYDAFDPDVIMHINSILAVVNQLGVGPEGGMTIEDDTPTWDQFLGEDPRKNTVKTYVYLRVRLLFDPPSTAHALAAIKEQYKELEWRINVEREGTAWTSPSLEHKL
jgi:hypothetical protein